MSSLTAPTSLRPPKHGNIPHVRTNLKRCVAVEDKGKKGGGLKSLSSTYRVDHQMQRVPGLERRQKNTKKEAASAMSAHSASGSHCGKGSLALFSTRHRTLPNSRFRK